MNLVDSLRRQFVYDEWANQEVIAALRASAADDRCLQLMAHVLSAERLWLERIRQQPQSGAVWPKADLDQCEAQAAELGRLWREYFDTVTEQDLSGLISYKNSKGEPWTSTLADILIHVAMHSAYHRGQIASRMREQGNTPANTDYIHSVRKGLVK